MLHAVLMKKCVTARGRVTVKGLTALAVITAAVTLPMLVHLAFGAGGVVFLPMYLPVVLGACLLGAKWGATVGILSPLTSYLVTSVSGTAMPTAERLPFMMAELAVFAVVCGLLSDVSVRRWWVSFVTFPVAALIARGSFLLLVFLFSSVTSLTTAAVFRQILAGWPGLLVMTVAVPSLVLTLGHRILR